MKNYEFVEKTDLITGEQFYFTRVDGFFLSNTFSTDKAKAYLLYAKAYSGELLVKYETLESKMIDDTKNP